MANKPTVYLAGPMTGIENHNAPAFVAGCQGLRAAGWTVLSPEELSRDLLARGELAGFGSPVGSPEHAACYARCMEIDVAAVLRAVDGVAVLPGWQQSKGARFEVLMARMMGRTIYDALSRDRLDPQPDVQTWVDHGG